MTDEERRQKRNAYMREWMRRHPRYQHDRRIQYQREWRAKTPEKQTEYNEGAKQRAKVYYQKHPEKVVAANRRRRSALKVSDPERLRVEAVYWRNHYEWGLTRELFESFRERLRGPCEICGAMGIMHIDHDHATNAFRGLLCRHCNYFLGFARDRIDVLRKAIEYLTAHGRAA